MGRKRARIPSTAKPKQHWWRGVIVSDSHCDNPNCNHEHDLNEHDPAGAFAYTIGLHDQLGLPELKLSALPRECSELPVLPVYELGPVLNAVTEHYIEDGGASSGVVFHGWPGGFEVRAGVESDTFPLSAAGAECYQASPSAHVLQVEWCAHQDTR